MISLIIAGSRTVMPTMDEITEHVTGIVMDATGDRRGDPLEARISEVVCGDADGADWAGCVWAERYKIPVHHEPVTPEDYKLGRYVGPKMRNRRMAERGTHALIYWGGISGGSADMAIRMVARFKPCLVIPKQQHPRR